MQILIFSHEYPPEVGGAGIVAQQFVHVLNEQKYDVCLLTRKKNKCKYNNIKIFAVLWSIQIKGFWFFSSIIRLLFFNFKKYDRIVINDFPSSVVASFLFSKKTLSRSIFMWHGSEDKTILDKTNWNGKFFRRRYIKAVQNSCKILAVSEFQKEKIIKGSGLEMVRNKTFVQYAGIDSNIFKMIDQQGIEKLSKELGLNKSDIPILSVGRINRLKGYREMYEIFKRLPDHFHWIIIGDGELKSWLSKQIELEGKKNIHLIGKVERKHINNYYNLAKLFFLFSHKEWQEAFGLVYIEAALAGTPVLARKKEFDGTNEAVKDIGWLLDSDDDAYRFLLEGEYLNVNRKEISKKAANYSLDNLKSKIINNICN